jgi:hypothetical protein
MENEMSKKGSYIGGCTVFTIPYSAKRMAARQAHWARKLGRDKVKQCLRGVFDNDGPRLIKRTDDPQLAERDHTCHPQSDGVQDKENAIPPNSLGVISPSSTGAMAEAQAYLDTVEIFFPYRPKGLLASIKSADCAQRPWFESCFNSTGKIVVGYRLVLQKPASHAFAKFEFWRKKHRGTICRVDIAFDFRCQPGTSRQSLISLISTQLLLRWSPRSWMREEKTTLYWVEQASRKRRSNRDLCFYSSRPSKLDGSPDCIHLELRLFRSETVKREAIYNFFDIEKLNPARLFKKHIRCVDYDPVAFEQNFVKSAAREDIRRHRSNKSTGRSSAHSFVDRYRSHIAERARGLCRRLGLGHVQNLKRLYPKRVRKMGTLRIEEIFKLPSTLSWS